MLSTLLVFYPDEDTFRTHEYNARRQPPYGNHCLLQLNVESHPVLLEDPRGAPANQESLPFAKNRKQIYSGYGTPLSLTSPHKQTVSIL